MIKYPTILDKIFDKLEKNGAKVIIVGGFIRNFLLGIPSDDIDIEVYNISSFDELEDILKEFGSVNSVGKSFGVCKVSLKNLTLDFTLPRIDSKVASGHTGFDIKIQKNLDFTTAAKRRDFTINAIGYDVVDKKILDPFSGINDLKNKILKMVNAKTFVEDPLRVLRAVQFCARFDLEMNRDLFVLCKKIVDEDMLSELPKERIYGEIKKLLLKSNKPSLGFILLKKLGALKYFLNCSASMKALDKLANLKTTDNKTDEVLMLATLCYEFSPKEIEIFISRLSDDKELSKRVLPLVENLNFVTSLCSNGVSDYKLYKLATKVKIKEIVILSNAVYNVGEEILTRSKELNILDKKMPTILRGRDLIEFGIKPSSKFSKILDASYEAQMHKEFSSHNGGVLWLRNNIYLYF